jgi:hypothetical protein
MKSKHYLQRRFITFVLYTLVASISFRVGNALADEQLAEHWQIIGPAARQPVMPGVAYGFKNLVINQTLVYGQRDWGINLKWDGQNRGQNIILRRAAASNGPLKYGERVAMQIKRDNDQAYLYYTRRDVGPNLGWSKEPKYEWEIRGGRAGDVVKTVEEVSLYSLVEKDYLVYCARPLSINLRWLKDKESKGCHGTWGFVKQKAKNLAKEAAKEGLEKGGAAAGTYFGGPVGGAAGGMAGKEAGERLFE